jgi:hypothetical protein
MLFTGSATEHGMSVPGTGKPDNRQGEETTPPKETRIKAFFLFTGAGPMVLLTSFDSIDRPELLKKLRSEGCSKFIAHEIPVEAAKARYGTHFDIVCQNLNETDDLRILDRKSGRAIKLFSFKEFGPPVYYEYEPDSFNLNRLPDYEAEYLRVYPKCI